MNKKIIISLIVIVGFIVFLGWLFIISVPEGDKEVKAATESSGQISTESNAYDFGTISMKNGNVSHVYKIKNSADKVLVITKLYTSCMCTKASLSVGGKKVGPFGMPGHGNTVPNIKVTLNPQEEAEIEAIFDPAAHGSAGIGKINRTVFVETGSKVALELSFDALVTP